uniref:RRM domain-containing protein n=1 Tax=Vannella robusta TaxID=1487602 RepID=A0A7S4HI81_9EUKA
MQQDDHFDSNETTLDADNDIKGPPKACLFVASLTNFTSKEELSQLFGVYGEILKIKLLKDHVSRPYAFIQFASVDDATNAIENTKNTILNNRRLRVERARVNRTLFVAKFSKQMQAAQLKEAMSEYGEIESVTIIQNHQTNRSKGCGFVKFAFREDAASALAALKVNQSKWVVEWATSSNDPETLRVDKNNIFVGGLNPQEITEEKLKERFQVYGEMESVTLVNRAENNPDSRDDGRTVTSPSPTSASADPNGTRPANAFAFIRYKDEEFSAAAIEAENGTDWLGKRIRVQYCESKEMKNKRRAKQMKYPYQPNPYYPGVPIMYLPDVAPEMQNNMYNSPYYPMYYNGAPPPWMYQMPSVMDVPGMMPNMGPMYPPNVDDETQVSNAFSQMNLGAGPSVVPNLPWLP